MCRVLGVSPSGYYAWLKREPSERSVANAELLEKIREIHEWSDGTYGSPRIHEELRKAQGIGVGMKRVARLMVEAGLEGVSRRRGTRTTQRGKDARPAPDLVDRDFGATGPDQLWVADSRTSRRGRASCTWPWCWTPGAAGWWAGRWPRT